MRQRILQVSLGALLFTGMVSAQNAQQPAQPPPDPGANPAIPPDPNAPPKTKSWGGGATTDGKGHWKSTNPAPQDAPATPPLSDKAPDPATTKKHSTADDNPFPEEQSKKAAQDTAPDSDAPKAAPGAKGGDSSSSQESSSQDKLQGLDLLGDKDARTSDGAGGTIIDPKLAAQDAKIGGFYLHTGDFNGAYSRFQEATRVDPGNAEAVFGLAEAARGLNHRREAIDNYMLYLQAVPDGAKAKDARKALKDLAPK
jgi:hypothetical protein